MKIQYTLAVVVIALVGAALWFGSNTSQHEASQPKPEPSTPVADNSKAYLNMEYVVGELPVTLVNGNAETELAPGSASKAITRYFGNEVRKDLDGDGNEDIAFLITQSTGGSGTFYYLVAAIKRGEGYAASDAVLLGDRIAPQTTGSSDGRSITVNYADRNPGEPLTTAPSLGKSMRLLLDPATLQFGVVANNFEGEANPSRMTLTMKSWSWISTKKADGTVVTPKQADKFKLTLQPDGTFSAATDCNTHGGSYTSKGSALSFGQMISTMMYCEGSQEQEFAAALSATKNYEFTSRGELLLRGKNGTLITLR